MKNDIQDKIKIMKVKQNLGFKCFRPSIQLTKIDKLNKRSNTKRSIQKMIDDDF